MQFIRARRARSRETKRERERERDRQRGTSALSRRILKPIPAREGEWGGIEELQLITASRPLRISHDRASGSSRDRDFSDVI